MEDVFLERFLDVALQMVAQGEYNLVAVDSMLNEQSKHLAELTQDKRCGSIVFHEVLRTAVCNTDNTLRGNIEETFLRIGRRLAEQAVFCITFCPVAYLCVGGPQSGKAFAEEEIQDVVWIFGDNIVELLHRCYHELLVQQQLEQLQSEAFTAGLCSNEYRQIAKRQTGFADRTEVFDDQLIQCLHVGLFIET